jgi:hypothetical protein
LIILKNLIQFSNIREGISLLETILKKIDRIKYENQTIIESFLNFALNAKKMEIKSFNPFTRLKLRKISVALKTNSATF